MSETLSATPAGAALPDPGAYESLLQEKTGLALYTLSMLPAVAANLPEPEIFRSAPLYYRSRASFGARRSDDGRLLFYMFTPGFGNHRPYELKEFAVAVRPINELMAALSAPGMVDAALAPGLFSASMLANHQGSLVLALACHRKITAPLWLEAASKLRVRLKERGLEVQLVGRARGQLLLSDSDTLSESFPTDERSFRLRLTEGHFSQPNYAVCTKMVNFARSLCRECRDQDLLELYCGSGTFTVCLAPLFRQVLATELTRVAADNAKASLTANGIENVRIVRLSDDETAAALKRVRPFRRLEQAQVNLDEYRFGTLLVDPPRQGLSAAARTLAQDFPRIIYVSCSPVSLKADLKVLAASHRVTRLAFFDQFPYTEHIETIALLCRK